MKKNILLILIIFSAAVLTNISAQEMPAGASDKDLRDNDVRMRSVEIERVKREANKPATGSGVLSAPVNTDIDKKYPQIKEDFENLQNNQAAIIKSYTTGDSIDYKQIKTSAEEITKNAQRLDENLFAPKTEEQKEKKEENKTAGDIKELIVELDNAVGNFVSSAMFQNLRVIDPQIAGKARFDLAKIMEISTLLSKAANKSK